MMISKKVDPPLPLVVGSDAANFSHFPVGVGGNLLISRHFGEENGF